MKKMNLRRIVSTLSLTLVLSSALLAQPSSAQSAAGDVSAVSVVVSVLAPAFFISEAGEYVVKSVEASGKGSVYVIEKIGTGVRGSVTITANASGALSTGIGSVIQTTATSAGMLLVSAGKVLAIIPNELGKALMKSEKIS